MARVFLLSATPANDETDFNLAPLLEAQKCAELDRFHVHSLTSDPDAADLIIFVEFYGGGWYFERVRQHPLVRKYREKCFLFCSNPFVIPFLPGVYTGIEKGWASARTRPGFYLGRTKNEFTTYAPASHDLPYLFSFMGAVRNAPIREKLASLHHPRSVFQDTTADFDRVLHRKMDPRERLDYHRRYADLIRATKFNLCPRGLSASSIRVFETMGMGRVPVILSDGWIPPRGPRWRSAPSRYAKETLPEFRGFWKSAKPKPSRWVSARAANGSGGFPTKCYFITWSNSASISGGREKSPK